MREKRRERDKAHTRVSAKAMTGGSRQQRRRHIRRSLGSLQHHLLGPRLLIEFKLIQLEVDLELLLFHLLDTRLSRHDLALFAARQLLLLLQLRLQLLQLLLQLLQLRIVLSTSSGLLSHLHFDV